MTTEPNPDSELKHGDRTYRAWVGNPEKYDVMAATQFGLLTQLGLREDHYLLDVGCGSLRGGRLFIPYLRPDRYFGIEPEAWLVEEGLRNEVGDDQARIKSPTFAYVDDFRLTAFGRRFDYILAQSIFSHASVTMLQRCLREAREVLEPEGVFVATFLEGEQDYAGEEWVYPECVTYRPASFRAIVESEGLRMRPVGWPHPAGQRWVAISHPSHTVTAPPESVLAQLEAARGPLERIARHPVYRAYREIRRLGRRLTGRSRP